MKDKIETKRLTLRQLELSDVDALSRLGGEFDIACMTGSFPHPFPPLSAEFRLMYLQQQWRQGLAYPYAVTLDDDELIGIVNIFRRHANAELEISYWLGKPYWGQGYATEAAQAIIDEAHRTIGATTIIAGVFVDNPASLHILQKLGFKLTGESGMYFSMTRLKNVHCLDLRLDLNDSSLELVQDRFGSNAKQAS